MRSIIQRVVNAAGREYTVDPALPRSFVVGEYVRRGTQAVRGLVTLRQVSFRGPGVRVRCPERLMVERFTAIGEGSLIDASGHRGVRLGHGAKLGRRVIVTTTSQLSKRGAGLTLGDFTGIGDYAHIGCSGGVTFGANVIAGPYLTCHSQEHITDDVNVPIRNQGTREEEVIVGDDVWIGARVTILSGARIGNGCVVAAGSVVRGEFPPRSIIGGIPARVLKTRQGTS